MSVNETDWLELYKWVLRRSHERGAGDIHRIINLRGLYYPRPGRCAPNRHHRKHGMK